MTSQHRSSGLARSESLALLASVPVGRVAFQLDVLPTVLTVNFSLSNQGVLVMARSEPLLEAARRRLYVVLQGDDYDLPSRCGWAVSVVGRAELVDDPMRHEVLDHLAPEPWAGRADRQLVSIGLELVEGCRVGAGYADIVGAR